MAVPAIPDAGKPWLTWAQGIDTEARKVATKADATDARFTDTRTPTDGTVTNAKVASGAAISADKLADGTTNKVLTATERTKLTGIATGATANSADATLLARANHTGTQSADTIVDGTTNHTFTAADDTKLTGVATGATANSTDAQLRDRSTHTGTQPASTITGLATVATSGAYADLAGKPAAVVATFVNAAEFGFLPTATAAANDAAIVAFRAALVSRKLPGFIPSGDYYISAPMDFRAISGITVTGAGERVTRIFQTTDSAEILQVGGYNNTFTDLGLFHSNQAVSSSFGSGLVFYKAAYCTFKRLEIDNNNNGITIAQTNSINPDGSTGDGSNWMFSCSFEDIAINRYAASGIYLHAYGGGRSTGSVWSNIYVQNRTGTGTIVASTGSAVDLFQLEESVFNQLNIEDWQGGAGLLAVSCGNIVINGLHFERANLNGYNSQYLRAYGSAALIVNAVSVGFSDVAAPGASGTTRLFSVAGGGRMDVRGISLNGVTKTGSNTFTVGEVDDTDPNNSLEFTYYVANNNNTALPSALTSAATKANAGLKRAGDLPVPASGTAQVAVKNKSGADLAITGFTTTQIPLALTTFSSGTTVSTATTDALVATLAGVYQPSAVVRFTGGASTEHTVILRVNGTDVSSASISAGGTMKIAGPSIPLKLNAGDVVTLWVYVGGSSVVVTSAGGNDTMLGLTYIGPST